MDASKKMRSIAEQLRSIRKEVSEILRTVRIATPTTGRTRTNSTCLISEPILYGRHLIKQSIIHDITRGKYCDTAGGLTVLPIFGQGGIGKTTLAQHIYQNHEVKMRFEVMVWKCVSLHFNVDKLLEDIVKLLPKLKDEKVGTSEELIEQRLKSKRFLLVLDDMWTCSDEDEFRRPDEDKWRRLLLPFQKSQEKGNIILVTTRFQALAQTVKTTNHTIALEGIECQEFEKLFLAFVFGDEQSARNDHAYLLDTGRKIMEKLKGSPLAAKTVGRLLRKNLELDHWIRVLESKEWELANNDNDIMPALKLSYDYLPFNLQQCFLYSALFPEDYTFDKEKLIYFWIGLDILHSGPENKSMEDIGLDNLDELVNYGFFRKEEKNGHIYYLIHDLLHDLALKVASNECLVISQNNVCSLEIRPSVRHLCIGLERADDSDGTNSENFISELRIVEAKLNIGNLQTLMAFGKLDGSFTNFLADMIEKANNLRVLHLSNMHSTMEFPTLPHLRYLSLGSIDTLIDLPRMLSRFYHLRIFDLQEWGGRPDLPRDFCNLAKLSHFRTRYDDGHSMICNVGNMQFIQELKMFRVNTESNGFELKQLGKLTDIRELGIYNLGNIHSQEEAIEANMMQKKYVKRLTLDWFIDDMNWLPENQRDVEGLVLEKLEPYKKLQDLCIRGHGSGSCPTWLGSKLSLTALRSLRLDRVEWNALPSLGHMGVLREVTLEHMSTIKEFGPRHFGSITEHSFCSLKRLKLYMLSGLEKWDLGDRWHLLSRLEVLIIDHCRDLSELPFVNSIYYPPTEDDQGKIHWFPNLQELQIRGCRKIMSLPPIPWTQTLCSVHIENVGSPVLEFLEYRKYKLDVRGKNDMHSLDVLAFHNLTDLRQLSLHRCPPLESKQLQMLTSLEQLLVDESKHVIVQPMNESEAERQQLLALEDLRLIRCGDPDVKELPQFLSGFPKLLKLTLHGCDHVTQIGVAVLQQQQRTAHTPPFFAASDAHEMKNAQEARHQKQIAEEVEETENMVSPTIVPSESFEDGMLLLPAHLSDSLQELCIRNCDEIRAVASPLPPNCSRLQALYSLQRLEVQFSPKFLSNYKKQASYSSCCFPFPSSLKEIEFLGVDMETLQPLENLISLTQLKLAKCGTDLRSDGLWPLVTLGQLCKLVVGRAPRFFLDSDQGPKDEDQARLLRRSSKLQELDTDDAIGFLVAPICTIIGSTLTKLTLRDNEEMELFTTEQEKALQLLTSLQDLTIDFFPKLQCLPGGLSTLPNLRRLYIRSCWIVSTLPYDGLPNSLQELEIKNCNKKELAQHCRKYVEDHPGVKLDIGNKYCSLACSYSLVPVLTVNYLALREEKLLTIGLPRCCIISTLSVSVLIYLAGSW